MKTDQKKPDFSFLLNFTLLYVEDEPDVHETVVEFLQGYFKQIYSAFDGKEGLELFQTLKPDVVLSDIRMPLLDGLKMAEKIKEVSPDTPVIIISAFYETKLLSRAIDIGIDKYVHKPYKNIKLLETIYISILPLQQKKEIQQLNKKLFTSLETRISASKRMKKVIERIQKVANSNFSVLLNGETGVGKSYVARIIHEMGNRADKPFITIDIGVIPETLLEAELFGHTRGAFTGANKPKKGFFEIAEGGTLFLEDLENISLYAQSKLLRAVEEKQIIPLGSTTPVTVDIRIIGATNKKIEELVKEGSFREDLFYRLCEFQINILPLRDRMEDIPILAEKFIQEVTRELGKSITQVSKEAIDLLGENPWKGNIRELKSIIRQVVLLNETDQITIQSVQRVLNPASFNHLHEIQDNKIDLSLSSKVKWAEIAAIRRALEKSGGKKVTAASLLKIDYKTLMTKMKKYGIGKLKKKNLFSNLKSK